MATAAISRKKQVHIPGRRGMFELNSVYRHTMIRRCFRWLRMFISISGEIQRRLEFWLKSLIPSMVYDIRSKYCKTLLRSSEFSLIVRYVGIESWLREKSARLRCVLSSTHFDHFFCMIKTQEWRILCLTVHRKRLRPSCGWNNLHAKAYRYYLVPALLLH